MSSLLGIHSISKAHGSQILFEDISFTISEGDRIGLIGPNGAGKSTLLKTLMGLETPDGGTISRRQGLRVGYASQLPEFPSMPLEELLMATPAPGDETARRTRARILLSKALFTDFNQNAQQLSGGWKKRLDIVKALMIEPDILLLDEPTNHLDLEGILWLEQFLEREKCAYMIISHDRYFLNNCANRVIELNRCYPQGLFISDGDMGAYMENKENFLKAQEQRERGLSSTVRTEIDWLRRSPQARTTKSKARIQNAYKLMDELAQVKSRNTTKRVDLSFSASERETRKLLVGKNLSKGIAGRTLFEGIDLTLSPGTRLGIVGKNGTGKTTLLKILAGMLPLDMGTLKYADDLKIVYFDQHRETIPGNITLKEALSPNSDYVNYHGQQIHVNGWAKRFLFSPDRLTLPVECLSGGERARILIARLMLQPADLLFLDEPTNDLDIPTLEVMEESLKEFEGAVVMISHDRCLMDRVCTSILGLGEGLERHFYADYAQWEAAIAEKPVKKDAVKAPVKAVETAPRTKKLSYKEQKELDGMEQAIADAEKKVDELNLKLADAAIDAQKSLELYHALGTAQQALDALFTRWQELLDKSN